MGPVSEVKKVQYVKERIKEFLGIEHIEHIVAVKWIIQCENRRTGGKSLVISNVINGTPEFAIVENIYVANSFVYSFECQTLTTVGWNNPYLAYEVKMPCLAQANIFIDAEELIDYTAYSCVNFNNKKYIPVKYDLTDVIKYHS